MQLTIDSPAYGGFFIGRHEGKVVMVKGAVIPGEKAEVSIEEEKKDYIAASVKRIIEPSPHRIKPACDYFGTCGGCHLQYISYEKQVQLKEDILRDCLRRLAKIDIGLSESIIDNNPWNYRFRGQFKISRGKIGFYREKTREVIDIETCPLMADSVNNCLGKSRQLLKEPKFTELHITSGDSYVALLKSRADGISIKGADKIAALFLSSGFSGLCIETQNRLLQYGQPYAAMPLDGLKYTISPMSFLQSHWMLNQKVVRLIKDRLQPLKGKKILDLYSGAGNFSLPIAGDAEVTAVEENPHAIADGKRNLKINNIKNCRFICSAAEKFYTKEHFNILILDPPRSGLTNRVINTVFTIMPEQIIYISCNPATLSRDLKKLFKKYEVESVRLIDFFPQTFHIESLVFLSLK